MTIANSFRTSVMPEWVDYNGHMRDAFYSLVFSYAVDSLMDLVGMDEAYRTRTSGTLYVLEFHKHFLGEVKEGAPLLVENRILATDAKRIHLHQTMTSGRLLSAVCESMQLHVSQAAGPRAAAMPDDIRERLKSLTMREGDIPALSHRAREMGMSGRKS